MNYRFFIITIPAERSDLAILQFRAVDVENIGPQSGRFAVLSDVVERKLTSKPPDIGTPRKMSDFKRG